jgi:hypothetical protein
MIEKFKGKTVIIYGEPASGKSFTIATIAKKIFEKTMTPAYLIWSDTNLFGEYGKELEEFSKAKVLRITSVNFLFSKLREIFEQEKFNHSFICLDSLSGIEEIVTQNESVGSPRRNLLLSQTARNLTFWLSKIAEKFNIPAFMIAHDTVLFETTWRYGEKTKPAFSRRAIKNVDVVIKHELRFTEENKAYPYWKILLYRSLKENLEGTTFNPLGE